MASMGAEDLLAGYPVAEGVYDVGFSADGRSVATVSSDQAVRLWEVHTGKERCKEGSIRCGEHCVPSWPC